MAYSHVAHDCLVGDNCIFSNNTTLAGHVTVGDFVIGFWFERTVRPRFRLFAICFEGEIEVASFVFDLNRCYRGYSSVV